MGWDTVAEKFLDLLKGIGGSRKSKDVISSEVKDILNNIIRITGAHRLTISQVKNGGGSLTKENDMYYTVLYCFEDERYVRKLPEINNMKMDVHFRYLVRRVIEEKKSVIVLGELNEKSILYQWMLRFGSNMSEYHLLHAEETKAFFIVLTTADIEVNPFDKNRMEWELEINKLKKYFIK